jgi:hypothetical protein
VSDTAPTPTPTPPQTPTRPADLPHRDEALSDHADGLGFDVQADEEADKRWAAIEMAGEEAAAGFKPPAHAPLSPEVRYLHVSRTIHELITDRNRSVGIFLFVASLLIGATTALLNAPEAVRPYIPLALLQYYCFPVTFTVLGVMGAFISLILIRTRIGLIYEVAKLNALAGVATTRVRRVNPLSIFFLMHLMVVLLGGASAGFAAGMVVSHGPARSLGAVAAGTLVALGYVALFQSSYYLMILRATTETKLAQAKG